MSDQMRKGFEGSLLGPVMAPRVQLGTLARRPVDLMAQGLTSNLEARLTGSAECDKTGAISPNLC